MTLTITETRVEERLQPEPVVYSTQKKATKHSVPYSLMRSASFDRLRQLPTYFCVNGSAEIFRWFFSSKNNVSAAFSDVSKQLQQILLTISVFGSLGVLLAQIAAVVYTLATAALPLGLHFLLTCTVIVGTIATQVLFPNSPQRRSRSTRRRPKD
uniref:Uncharacterized protein n=1 Tax=Lygus hesperus TaxID=30085 RepID=A0A0K8SLR6_LYGHE